MIIDQPILRILRKIKTDKGTSALTLLIKHLKSDKEMTPKEIAAILQISISAVHRAIKSK